MNILKVQNEGFEIKLKTLNEVLELGMTRRQLSAIPPPPPKLPGWLTFPDMGWHAHDIQLKFKMNPWNPHPARRGIFDFSRYVVDRGVCYRQEKPCYRQIKMQCIEGSEGRSFREHRRMLKRGERLPNLRRVLMAVAVFSAVTGYDRLYEFHVRTDDERHNATVSCLNYKWIISQVDDQFLSLVPEWNLDHTFSL